MCDNASTMQLHESLHEGEPDTETPLAAVDGRLDLREHLENRGQFLRGDSESCVAHRDDQVAVLLICTETDSPTGIRVFRGICQQIRDDLRDPQGIYDDRYGSFRHFDAQGMAARVNERSRGFDRRIDHCGKLDGCLSQFQFAEGDSGNVQQIVQQHRHVLRLAADDVIAPAQLRLGDTGHGGDSGRLSNRSQWVAQFMCQCREEFILAAVGLTEFRAGLAPYF